MNVTPCAMAVVRSVGHLAGDPPTLGLQVFARAREGGGGAGCPDQGPPRVRRFSGGSEMDKSDAPSSIRALGFAISLRCSVLRFDRSLAKFPIARSFEHSPPG